MGPRVRLPGREHPYKPRSPQQREAFAALWNDLSIPLAEIARRFGCGERSVQIWRKEFGLLGRDELARARDQGRIVMHARAVVRTEPPATVTSAACPAPAPQSVPPASGEAVQRPADPMDIPEIAGLLAEARQDRRGMRSVALLAQAGHRSTAGRKGRRGFVRRCFSPRSPLTQMGFSQLRASFRPAVRRLRLTTVAMGSWLAKGRGCSCSSGPGCTGPRRSYLRGGDRDRALQRHPWRPFVPQLRGPDPGHADGLASRLEPRRRRSDRVPRHRHAGRRRRRNREPQVLVGTCRLEDRPVRDRLVKSNIGHALTAACPAGLLKVLCAGKRNAPSHGEF